MANTFSASQTSQNSDLQRLRDIDNGTTCLHRRGDSRRGSGNASLACLPLIDSTAATITSPKCWCRRSFSRQEPSDITQNAGNGNEGAGDDWGERQAGNRADAGSVDDAVTDVLDLWTWTTWHVQEMGCVLLGLGRGVLNPRGVPFSDTLVVSFWSWSWGGNNTGC